MYTRILCLLFLSVFMMLKPHSAWSGGNDHGVSHRPDGHAPIGVMGDHVHGEGEWMTSYRYMFMDMQGNQFGEDEVSDNRVLDDFMITPTDMQMQMHMIGVMYAPKDELTLMTMMPVIRKDMNHVNRAGVRFRTNSQGLGDIRLSGLVPFASEENRQWHANLGLSVPTGSINQIDDLPTGKGKRLPYPMQLGSGTVDALPGLTFQEHFENGSWGAQTSATIRIGRNRVGYALGDQYEAQVWGSYVLLPDLSLSARLHYLIWSNIDGSDPAQVATLVPTADTQSRGGKRIDLLFGLNWYPKTGFLAGHRLALEAGMPVFESLDGPQLSTEWIITAGWQKAF